MHAPWKFCLKTGSAHAGLGWGFRRALKVCGFLTYIANARFYVTGMLNWKHDSQNPRSTQSSSRLNFAHVSQFD